LAPQEVPEVTFEIVDVTPEIAEEMLVRNKRNRRFRPGQANKYARDMQHGLWRFNGEPIQIDWNGQILNGQHRLTAVVKSRTTQKFLVVSNLPPEAQDTMDSGAKRTPGDVLSLRGHRDGRTMASIARLALQVELSPLVARESRNWTTGEITNRIERDDYMVKIAEDVIPQVSRQVQLLLPRSVLGYCMYRLGQLNESSMLEFFDRLGSLANLPADSPILALNRRLTSKLNTPRSSLYQFEQLACVFTAWNAWRKGEPRHQIRLTPGADGRVKIPVPL
jgi:hypothetical protein